MIELLFVAEQFQCGASADPATFEVVVFEYANQHDIIPKTTHFLEVTESVVLPISDPTLFDIEVRSLTNASCTDLSTDSLLIEINDVGQLPSVPGLYNQPSIESYIESLESSQAIIYGEFGCGSEVCESADWQDVVIRVDYNYNPVVYAD